MKTRELQTLWWDWLSTSERLLNMLQDQTRALIGRDVATVERLQPELDAMLEKMTSIDDRAAASARALAEELGTEPSLRSLVEALPKAEAQQIQSLANRVRAASNNVELNLAKNRQLIASELTYVNGTLVLIARAAQEQNAKYGGSNVPSAVLVDQVA